MLGLVPAASAACAPTRTLIAHGYGAPDDLAIDRGRILFSDEPRGILAAAEGGRVRVLARGLRGPEGIVVRSHGRVVVAEQALNRIVELQLASGRRTTLVSIPNRTGRLGIDGLAPAPHGGIYIPDSPHGRLLLLDRTRHLYVLARGMGRPVGAVRFKGGVAVADETSQAVWQIVGGRTRRLATVPTPDDVVVFKGHLLAVTLGDGSLWEIAPRRRRLLSGFGDPQGLAVMGGGVVIADSRANAIYRVSGIGSCFSP